MIITSNHKAPLGLPSGITLQPGTPTLVPHWESDKRSAIVRAWVKSGLLKEGGDMPSQFVSDLPPDDLDDAQTDVVVDPETDEPNAVAEEEPAAEAELDPAAELSPADEKTQLLATLAARGIKADKRTGIKKLRDLLAESDA